MPALAPTDLIDAPVDAPVDATPSTCPSTRAPVDAIGLTAAAVNAAFTSLAASAVLRAAVAARVAAARTASVRLLVASLHHQLRALQRRRPQSRHDAGSETSSAGLVARSTFVRLQELRLHFHPLTQTSRVEI